jgi:hypothetical protein
MRLSAKILILLILNISNSQATPTSSFNIDQITLSSDVHTSTLYPSTAQASQRHPNQCTTIDFRNQFQLKMRNQNNVSWCFAHSSADLLQTIYQMDTQISAADIAIRYSTSRASRVITGIKKLLNRNSGKIPAQTGFIKIATDLILKEGYCPESALPSEQWKKINQDGTVESIEISKAILETLKIHEDYKKGMYPDPASLPWFYSFKNIDRDRFFDLLEISNQKNIFQKLRDFACSTDRKQFPYEIKTTFRIKSDHLLDQIDFSFERGKPVTIDFFSDVLRHTETPKRSIDELHTVLLFGRKYDHQKNECMYLIKDSYGEQCKKYDASLECESGYVWMPAKKLMRAATSGLIHSQSLD